MPQKNGFTHKQFSGMLEGYKRWIRHDSGGVKYKQYAKTNKITLGVRNNHLCPR